MAELGRLPGPVEDRWTWQYEAACRDADPALFFAAEGERGGHRARRENAALAYCRRCPVVQECLDHAMGVREPYGLWGGTNEGVLHRRYESVSERSA